MLKPALICCPIAALMTVLAWSAAQPPQPQKKTVAPKAPTTQAKTAAHKAPVTQVNAPVSARKTIARPATKAGAGHPIVRHTGTRQGQVRTAAAWRPRQVVPSPERYKEIQDALASRGYLQPEQATGVWDQNSVDALKRFQDEQKLESSGKLNSLSLIALGLGPKHDNLSARPVADPGPGQIQ
ncbi:MAG: peptidoglycan-binding domain-containing protein [Bryobacteraceae bacterium]|jgi:hypothetical protein